MEELEYYNFVEVVMKGHGKKNSKDIKLRHYALRVDMNELIDELDSHPQLKGMKETQEMEKAAKEEMENAKKPVPN